MTQHSTQPHKKSTVDPNAALYYSLQMSQIDETHNNMNARFNAYCKLMDYAHKRKELNAYERALDSLHPEFFEEADPVPTMLRESRSNLLADIGKATLFVAAFWLLITFVLICGK